MRARHPGAPRLRTGDRLREALQHQEEAEVAAALDGIRAVLDELGVGPGNSRERYTDAVAAARRIQGSGG